MKAPSPEEMRSFEQSPPAAPGQDTDQVLEMVERFCAESLGSISADVEVTESEDERMRMMELLCARAERIHELLVSHRLTIVLRDLSLRDASSNASSSTSSSSSMLSSFKKKRMLKKKQQGSCCKTRLQRNQEPLPLR